jgi:hypothetical protein
MAPLSTFASQLLEEAKRFLERAEEIGDEAGKSAFLHAAVLIGFAALEAHVNAIADDFLSRSDLNAHERGVLAEHVVELSDGRFLEKNDLKMWRLQDRVLFLCRRFSDKSIDRRAAFWGDLLEATKLRDKLTHPKSEPPVITTDAVRRALKAIIELLAFMFKCIYKSKLPAHARGLSSKLTF